MWVVLAIWEYEAPDPKVYGPFSTEEEARCWRDEKKSKTTRTLIIRPIERP